MEFSTMATRRGPDAPFAAVARPPALARHAGAPAPTHFAPDTGPPSPHPHLEFPARPHELAPVPRAGAERSRLQPDRPDRPLPAPPPLISTAAVTPVVLPRPLVAQTSEHERSAPDAAIVALAVGVAVRPTATTARPGRPARSCDPGAA